MDHQTSQVTGKMKIKDILFEQKEFKLLELPYNYNSLEPYIDKETMEEHHSKHHNGYVTKLNKALEGKFAPLSEIFANIDQYDDAVRNNAGGVYNHNIYFNLLSADPAKAPVGELKDQMESTFGSYDDFKEKFKASGLGQFGSGWAWLVYNDGKLNIISTPNQDNPLMSKKGKVIIGMDVWEHAYYLKHKSQRGDYIDDFFEVLCWNQAEENYQNIING